MIKQCVLLLVAENSFFYDFLLLIFFYLSSNYEVVELRGFFRGFRFCRFKFDEIYAFADGLIKFDEDFAANFFNLTVNKSDDDFYDQALE